MTAATSIGKMSYAEYLAHEERSQNKHEFLNGEVFAMADRTVEHGALSMAVGRALGNALEGKPGRILSSDVKVRILATGLSTYPDVSVVCGALETAQGDPNAVTNPVILVEVLSDSTEAYDRGQKAAHYRRIPSLREYVLVSQRSPLIEVHRRNERGNWELVVEAGAGQSAELASVGALLDVDAIYRNPLAAQA
jgi:Uma2 family endonuclease